MLFNNIVKKEYVEKNPLTVLESVYAVIVDRMKNPKEDSYTNAVMEKGIDEILKSSDTSALRLFWQPKIRTVMI